MKITQQMDLGRLQEMMGSEATITDAMLMNDLLFADFWIDTDEIPEEIWEDYLGELYE